MTSMPSAITNYTSILHLTAIIDLRVDIIVDCHYIIILDLKNYHSL